MSRVQVQPELLRWARERAGYSLAALQKRFPRLEAWEQGQEQPTLRQLEAFANTTRVPVGYLFLPSPPELRLPVPDFRTPASRQIREPSPELLDTIFLCQQRQAWYREFAVLNGYPACKFVGSASQHDSAEETAARMRHMLGFDVEERSRLSTWTQALRRFVEQSEALGVLVMVSSVVGSNTYRKLDPGEFRGFALSDDLAPVVFVNGADTKAAQMFTLAHELAHLWLGQSAVSDVGPITQCSLEVERWCNRVAAEFLVPLARLREAFREGKSLEEEKERLAKQFKVSTLVILRRLHDAGLLTRDALEELYTREEARLRQLARRRGGDFYLTQTGRVSRRFAQALLASTFEGHCSFTDAFRLLGIRNVRTLRRFCRELGISE